jgi:shikimate kinase
LSNFLKNETYAEIKDIVDKKKKESLSKGELEKVSDLTKVDVLLSTGGGIMRRINPYIIFTKKCILSKEKPKTLGRAQLNLKKCAEEWNKLSDEEKKKFSEEGYEIYNLP